MFRLGKLKIQLHLRNFDSTRGFQVEELDTTKVQYFNLIGTWRAEDLKFHRFLRNLELSFCWLG